MAQASTHQRVVGHKCPGVPLLDQNQSSSGLLVGISEENLEYGAWHFFFKSLSCVWLLRPHVLQPAKLLCPWDSPGKNTGVSYHFLLQGIFLTQGWNPHPLHCRQIFLLLSHQRSPISVSIKPYMLNIENDKRNPAHQVTKNKCNYTHRNKHAGIK